MTVRHVRGRRWLLIATAMTILALALAGVTPRAAAQQDAIDRARANAQQWLLKRIERPDLLLVEYTYSLTTWPNTARGCPVAGQTYEAQEVTGYRWTFLFDNLVRYEVHSDVDGNDVVLCWAQSLTSEAQLGVFNTTTFAILKPEAWLVFPNDNASEVLFAPQQDAPCDQPGMRVRVLGRVASGVTADRLLTDRLSQLGAAEQPGARESAGASGRSAVFETDCDGAPRRVKLTAFVQYGSAYEIEQWAPAAHFDNWRPLFRNMLSQFTPGAGTLIPGMAIQPPAEPAAPESAPQDAGGETAPAAPGEPAAPAPVDLAALPPFPLAQIFLGDVFLGALNNIPGRSVTNSPDAAHRFVTFSPDGLAIAFIDAAAYQLRMLPVENISPRTLAGAVSPDFPPAWSPDSARIAYIGANSEASADSSERTIYTLPATGGDSVVAGAFRYETGCDETVSDPADGVYAREAGPDGVQNVLEWLPGGQFLVSTGCAGGLALLDPASGQLTSLGDDLRGGALSPDRARFLARTSWGPVLIDLPAGTRTDLGLDAKAQALGWEADGSAIYVSTAALADEQTLDGPADEARGRAVFGFWPVTIGVYDLTLTRVDLAGPVESTLWQGQGRAIGQIAPAPDGSGVLFSVIPSSLLLAEVFQAQGDAFALESVRPTPALFWLARGSSAAVLLAYAGQPAFAPVTVAP